MAQKLELKKYLKVVVIHWLDSGCECTILQLALAFIQATNCALLEEKVI